MWTLAWIPGITLAVPPASMSAMMCDARECALDDERNKAGNSKA